MRAYRTVASAAALSAVVWLALTAPVVAQDDEAAVAEATTAIASKLKDPESARLRDVVRVVSPKTGKTSIICGWVNAKNSFGGYVGFRPFYVLGDMFQVRDADSADNSYTNSLFTIMWAQCVPPTGEKFGDDLVELPKINVDKQCAKMRKYVPDAADCEQREAKSRNWLAAHPTAKWIAMRCSQEARESRSYSSAKSCVENMEADVVFQRGPRG